MAVVRWFRSLSQRYNTAFVCVWAWMSHFWAGELKCGKRLLKTLTFCLKISEEYKKFAHWGGERKLDIHEGRGWHPGAWHQGASLLQCRNYGSASCSVVPSALSVPWVKSCFANQAQSRNNHLATAFLIYFSWMHNFPVSIVFAYVGKRRPLRRNGLLLFEKPLHGRTLVMKTTAADLSTIARRLESDLLWSWSSITNLKMQMMYLFSWKALIEASSVFSGIRSEQCGDTRQYWRSFLTELNWCHMLCGKGKSCLSSIGSQEKGISWVHNMRRRIHLSLETALLWRRVSLVESGKFASVHTRGRPGRSDLNCLFAALVQFGFVRNFLLKQMGPPQFLSFFSFTRKMCSKGRHMVPCFWRLVFQIGANELWLLYLERNLQMFISSSLRGL